MRYWVWVAANKEAVIFNSLFWAIFEMNFTVHYLSWLSNKNLIILSQDDSLLNNLESLINVLLFILGRFKFLFLFKLLSYWVSDLFFHFFYSFSNLFLDHFVNIYNRNLNFFLFICDFFNFFFIINKWWPELRSSGFKLLNFFIILQFFKNHFIIFILL